jgi:hypothetical protein
LSQTRRSRSPELGTPKKVNLMDGDLPKKSFVIEITPEQLSEMKTS